MAWKILYEDNPNDQAKKVLEEFSEITSMDEYEDKESLSNDFHKFDAVLPAGSTEMVSDLIPESDNLKVFSKLGVDVSIIDIPTATEKGIFVCNTPGANAQAVTEHTIGLILAVKKSIPQANTDVKNGFWKREEYKANELRSETLGLYGCGDIGQQVAKIGKSLGMEVLTYDPYISEYNIQHGIKKVKSKEKLLEESDVISIHVTLTDETKHSIGESEFNLMSSSDILINTARGDVIVEEDLAKAISNDQIGGAGLDVLSNEPPKEDNKLVDLDDVVLTSHLGGATVESDQEKRLQAAKNIKTVYNGNIPSNTVNLDGLVDINSIFNK